MAIENRNLAAGTRLVATYKKADHFCDVLKLDDGLGFQLADGKVFKSPSSAGKAITGRVSCDGWKFWSLAKGAAPAATSTEASEPEQSEPETLKAKAEPKTPAVKMVRVIKKMPNQKAVAEGSTKWWCSCRMKAFVTESTLLPELCPEGHPREQADEFAAVPAEAAEVE